MTAPSLSQWPRLSLLLDELLDLSPAAQDARLAALRAEDPTIAEAVEGLLGRQTSIERDGFLQQPARLPGEARQGQTIGAYEIEREIGQGGMGTVWLARRTDGRFEGRVALKFLSMGFATRGGAARFTREGSLLARLAHPHIARLLDAGLAPGNQPYLVLDYVDGLPIDQFCDRAGLDTPARVRLCLDVLDAVAHAHTRLILHRDIKPGNILVTAEGDVKLLDFGIAKLLDDQTGAGAATELTRESGNAFTWLYAAPEQVQGGEVSTATDVFALGVLLYLLLTGQHPGGIADTPMERMRRLVDEAPPLMSQTGAQRARQLRGDLDTIVAKALKKRPQERYANAEQMADDLRRWLHDEPILARRDARLYRVGKFIKRYRAGVALGTLTFAGLSGGIGVALWQAAEARGQHQQAEGLIEFMLGDLRTKLQPVGRLDVLDVVGDKALAYYAAQDDSRLDANSLGRRARALHLIGEIADSRGKLDDALLRFTEAEKSTAMLLARAPKDEQRLFDHAQSAYWVGLVAWRQGRLADAESHFNSYAALAARLLEINPRKPEWQMEVAFAKQNLGVVLHERGRHTEARDLLLFAQTRLRGLLEVRPDMAAELANNLGWVSRIDERLGRLGAALDGLEEQQRLLKSNSGYAKDLNAQAGGALAAAEASRLALLKGQTAVAIEQATAAHTALLAVNQTDPSNAQWQQYLASAYLRSAQALGTSPQLSAQALAYLAQAEHLLRLLEAKSPKEARRWINLQGAASILRMSLVEARQRQAAILNLRQWMASQRLLPQEDGLRSLVARAALMLGDQAHARQQDADARAHWLLAAEQAEDKDPHPDLEAAACAAQAAARLGDLPKARRLARLVVATEYQHPADLVALRSLAESQAEPSPQQTRNKT